MWKVRLFRYGKYNKNSNIRVLDVGCGEGYFLKCLEKWFPYAELFGIDISDDRLKVAKEKLNRAKLIRHDAHILPFPDKFFDVVSALQLLEHLQRPNIFLKEVNRVVKGDGFFLFSTPNPDGIAARLLKEKWHGLNPEHISLKSPLEWRNILKLNGFKIIEDGTTGITGIKILRIFPFSLINWLPMAIFGFFPWYKGESYMGVAKKIE